MDNPSPRKTEQIPHSGNLLTTPSSPAELIESGSEKKKSKRGLYIGVGAAGLALAAGAVFGVNALNQPPKSEPVATALADPTESPTEPTTPPVETEVSTPPTNGELPTVEQLEIPAGLSAEAFGKTLLQDGVSAWQMAGTTEENQLAWVKSGDNGSAFLDELSQKNAEVYAAAYLVPNWQSDPALVDFVNNMTRNNKDSLELYFKTTLLGQDPYSFNIEVNSAEVTPQDSGNVYVLSGTEHNNAATNEAGVLEPNLIDINGTTFTLAYTTQIIDGKEKISSIATQ